MAAGIGRAADQLIGAFFMAGFLVVADLLTGCAGGGVGAAAPLGAPRIGADWIEGASGDRLALSVWPARGAARAVILGVHGFGDYGENAFAAAAADWTARGLTVYAYDQRGFGRNASRGEWPGAGVLIDDFAAVVRAIKARAPDLPLFVVGHSMGGGVVAAALGEGLAPEVDGAVLMAPAIWGGADFNPFYRAAAWTAALIAPDKRWTGRGMVRIQASDNIEMLRALARDPIYLAPPSSREILGLIRLMDRARSAAPHVQTPVLMLHGAKDQVIPAKPLRAAFEAFVGEKRYIEYPEGWHMLTRDLIGAKVRRDVADWTLARAAP